MTKVTIYKNEFDECVGFRAYGHAGYDDEGYDIVCAAISVLTINTMNAIEAFTEEDFSVESNEEEGYIDYRVSDRPAKESTLLLNTMILGLESIVENYENYIDLKFEEV